MIEKIERRKLCDEVADRLLKSIEAGNYAPGDRLPSERELVARFGVGRPAVREALQTLERMGVIEITHGEPARLVSLDPWAFFTLMDGPARHMLRSSPQTIEHLGEARLFFEVGMVRLAVQRGTEEDVRRLAESLERMRESAGQPQKFVESDMAFHTTIATFARNPIYAALSEFLLRWLFHYYPRMVRVPGAEQLTITEHELVYRRIAERDEEGAVKAMTDHLTRANPQYAQYLAAANAGAAPKPARDRRRP